MNSVIKMLLLATVGFAAQIVSADDLLSCKDAKKMAEGPVLEFVIKSTKSRRLGSDLFNKSAAGVNQIISSLQVAQYAFSAAAAYVLIDDPTESPIMSFQAVLPNKTKVFGGAIQELDPVTGKVKNNRLLKCTLVTL